MLHVPRRCRCRHVRWRLLWRRRYRVQDTIQYVSHERRGVVRVWVLGLGTTCRQRSERQSNETHPTHLINLSHQSHWCGSPPQVCPGSAVTSLRAKHYLRVSHRLQSRACDQRGFLAKMRFWWDAGERLPHAHIPSKIPLSTLGEGAIPQSSS